MEFGSGRPKASLSLSEKKKPASKHVDCAEEWEIGDCIGTLKIFYRERSHLQLLSLIPPDRPAATSAAATTSAAAASSRSKRPRPGSKADDPINLS